MIQSYADLLKRTFPNLIPEIDDLFLLEAHQIADLAGRLPGRELAAVLHAYPRLRRFLTTRHPPIEEFLERLLTEHGPVPVEELPACEHAVVWEVADWIVYQRSPEYYDSNAPVEWDLEAVTALVSLDGKVVVDAGAGTGRVTLAAASSARHVFAVEPVAALRRYLRLKAAAAGFENVFVVDGFLHAIPLPTDSADVLLTCQAIGWDLPAELAEIDRVVSPGGVALHLLGGRGVVSPESRLVRALVSDGYRSSTYEDRRLVVHRYWKRLGT